MTEKNIKNATLAEIHRMKGDDELEPPRIYRSAHLKLDPEVSNYFKQQGRGYTTRMQDVLKAHVKAQQSR